MRLRPFWVCLTAGACLSWAFATAWAKDKADRAKPRPPDLLFRATFDRMTAFADFAKGDAKSTLDTSLELRAKTGAVGNCLLLDNGEKCEYQGEGNLNPAAGTIALWIKPANWSAADSRFVYFFVFQGRWKEQPNRAFTLVVDKPDSPGTARALFTMGARQDPDFKQYQAMGKADWKPDLWNKLDVTWNSRHLAIYVNGRLGQRLDLPDVAIPELTRATIGLVPIWTGPKSQFRTGDDRTYVDEVEIYGQVHSAERILERYLADRPDDASARESLKSLPKQAVSISYVPDVPGKKLGLEFDLATLDPDWLAEVQAGRATLEVAAGGSRQKIKLSGPAVTAYVPFVFREGKHLLKYTIRSSNRTGAFSFEDSLTVPDLDWMGTKVGVSDKVLEPWTALEYDGKGGVSCWGRRYEFEGPLPSKAVVTGRGRAPFPQTAGEKEPVPRDILRGPVRLTLDTGRGKGDLTEHTRKTVSKGPGRVEYAGTASFGNLAVGVDWECWMEYDGLVVGAFTIKAPRTGLKIESLTMRIPLREGLKYLRGARQNPNRLEWDGKEWRSGFEPFLWVVSEDEGFLYFCESEANWVAAQDQTGRAPMTIVRGGAESEIELRIIGQPVTAKEPLRYQFGFQATPVKPLDADWRVQNYGPGGSPLKHQNLQPWMNGYALYEGLWLAARPEALREFEEKRVAEGLRVYYYACTSCTPDISPVYRFLRMLWTDPYPAQFGPQQTVESRLQFASPPYYLAPVCPGSPTFVEYELWLAKRLADQIGARGFYTDTDDLWQCDNRRHGCGFTDVFGKSGVTWGILNKRQFAKRMAALMRSLGGEKGRGYWLTHAHSKLTPPFHCFADAFYPGEEYTHRVYGNKWWYIADMPEADYRVQLSPLASGMVHAFLPEFMRGTKDEQDIKVPGPTESLLAMCAVNDVNCTAAYMHGPSMEEWWGLRERLGVKNAAFSAYWRPDCPVKVVSPEEGRAGVYTWQKKRGAVVPVANRRPEDAEIVVKVDLKALGLSASVAAVDERTGKRLALRDGQFSVPVKGRNYTYVSLK